jgi:hypothetical protein
LEATPLVKGISASQISPACGIVVKSFVFGCVTVQEGAVVAKGQRCLPAALHASGAKLSHPRRELLEIVSWELLDNSLKFFDSAHVESLHRRAPKHKNS